MNDTLKKYLFAKKIRVRYFVLRTQAEAIEISSIITSFEEKFNNRIVLVEKCLIKTKAFKGARITYSNRRSKDR